MKHEELLTNEGYLLKTIQLDLFDAITDYLEKNDISQTEFAKQIGTSKGYVSQILNGRFDHKLSKLVKLSIAIGVVPVIQFKDFSSVCFESRYYDTLDLNGNEPRRKWKMFAESKKMENEENAFELSQTYTLSLKGTEYGFTGS